MSHAGCPVAMQEPDILIRIKVTSAEAAKFNCRNLYGEEDSSYLGQYHVVVKHGDHARPQGLPPSSESSENADLPELDSEIELVRKSPVIPAKEPAPPSLGGKQKPVDHVAAATQSPKTPTSNSFAEGALAEESWREIEVMRTQGLKTPPHSPLECTTQKRKVGDTSPDISSLDEIDFKRARPEGKVAYNNELLTVIEELKSEHATLLEMSEVLGKSKTNYSGRKCQYTLDAIAKEVKAGELETKNSVLFKCRSLVMCFIAKQNSRTVSKEAVQVLNALRRQCVPDS